MLRAGEEERIPRTKVAPAKQAALSASVSVRASTWLTISEQRCVNGGEADLSQITPTDIPTSQGSAAHVIESNRKMAKQFFMETPL